MRRRALGREFADSGRVARAAAGKSGRRAVGQGMEGERMASLVCASEQLVVNADRLLNESRV